MTTPASSSDKGDIVARDDGVHVAKGDGSGTSRDDYDNWNWKYIMTAITGVGAAGGLERQHVFDGKQKPSDPSTLWNAALSFRQAQEILEKVNQSITNQIEALAGEHGPWQGEAATAYREWMKQFAKAFHNHAEQIGGGIAAQNPVPEQLWTAGNYLAWAIKAVHDIDAFYANEALRIAAIKGEDIVIENETQGNTIHVSKYPEIVKLLDRDMRTVLKTLATEYKSQQYSTDLTPVPTPDPFTSQGGPNVDPSNYIPPPGPGSSVPPPPPYTPPPPIEIPPPPPGGSVPPPGGQGSNYIPPSFDPGKFDPGKFDAGNPGPRQFDGGGSGPGAFDPGAFTPGNASIQPPPGTSFDPGGGSGQSAFNPNDFTGGTDPGGSRLPDGGGTAFVPPPASFGPITPPPTTGRSNSNGAGGSSSPGEFTPGEFTPGAPDLSTPFKPGQFTGVSVPDPNNWAAGQGAGNAGNSDRNGIGMPGGMPPGMPFAPGAGNGANAAERSDASGLVSGGTGAWEGADIPGLGDPSQKPGEGTAPSQKPNEWAASGPGGVGVPGMGGMPMVPPGAPPFSPAAGNGAGGSERSDASGLIGGETEPWEGVDAPGLGEPSGGTVPQQSAETWAASGPGGVGVPGMGGMPMVPPGAPPFSPAAGNGAGGSERSDASGLIGGETEPWEGVDAPGLGDPSGGTVPGLAAQDWEPSSGDQVATSGVPMMPGVPFAPAAGNGANAPERSDASGLVAGGAEAWEGVEVAGLGDPGGVEAPPATREERVQATGAQPVPSIPVVHPAPSGPGEKRREGAAGAPSGLGAQAPATSGGNLPGAVADVVPLVAEDDRVAVVTPDDGNEDFSAWDAGASAGLPWLLTSSRSEDDRDEEPETPDYTLRETTGWGHTAGRTGVVRPDGASAVAAVDISDFVPRFQPPVTELSSSGLDAPEETEPAEETDESEEEQDERTSADLLKQDEKAWGGDSMPKASPGVIE